MVLTKKQKEKIVFERFSHIYFGEEIPFKQPKPPLPDVVFNRQSKKIAVEITEIKSDADPGKTSNLSSRVASVELINSAIQEKIRAVQPKGLLISIHYNMNWEFENEKRDDLVLEISRYLYLKIKKTSANTEFQSRPDEILPSGIMSCTISKIEDLDTYCGRILSHWAPTRDLSHLNKAMLKKAKSRINYQDIVDNCWLLLVMGLDLSSDFDLTIQSKIDEMGWDKIFLLNFTAERITEL